MFSAPFVHLVSIPDLAGAGNLAGFFVP